MDADNNISCRREFFKFNDALSNAGLGIFVYEYFKKSELCDQYFVVFENNDITFKRFIKQGSVLHTLIEIPNNTHHHNVLDIEQKLIRLQKPQSKQDEKDTIKIKELLTDFIRDFYINRFFKESGEEFAYKSSLEYIPLLKGLIYQTQFDFYATEIFNQLESAKGCSNWQVKEVYNSKLEDCYIEYSTFLRTPFNERLFVKCEWFNEGSCTNSRWSVDNELERIEKIYGLYLKSQANCKSCNQKNIIKETQNINFILRRYGLFEVADITLGKPFAKVFCFSLMLIPFIIIIKTFLFDPSCGYHITHINSLFKLILWITLCISLLSFIVIYFITIRRYNKIILSFLYPRLFIAILSGWIFFFTGEKLIKIDMDIRGIYLCLTLVIFIGVIFGFMYQEIERQALSLKLNTILKRVSLILSVAFIMSYSIGYLGMSFVNRKSMSFDYFLLDEADFKKEYESRLNMYLECISKIERQKKEYEKNNDKLNKFLDFLVSEQKGHEKSVSNSMIFNINNYKIEKFISQSITCKHTCDDKQLQEIDLSFVNLNQIANDRINHFNSFIDTLFKELYIKGNKIIAIDRLKQNQTAILLNKDSVIMTNLLFLSSENTKIDALREKIDRIPSPKNALLSYLEKGGKLIIEDKEYYFKASETSAIFPNALLFRSVIAVFLGFFLQLFFQDKPITAPE